MGFFLLFTIFITISKARTDSLLTGPYDQNSTATIMGSTENDVLQQSMNQGPYVPNMVNEVKAVMDDVNSVKRMIASTETMISAFLQTVETLKIQNQENNGILMNCQNRIHELVQRLTIRNENITDKSALRFTAKDCMDLYINGHTESGVYQIRPYGTERQITVYCDMVTRGGGWTAIQKRTSGEVTFNKTWEEYKTGFGDPADSYWIGNDVIHHLSVGRNPFLYISITLENGTKYHELYDKFSISDEPDKYRLFLGGPATGTLGDSLLYTTFCQNSHSGMYFSTIDRDHDRKLFGSCASEHGSMGGWWFNWCHDSFLNGPWAPAYWARPWFPTIRRGTGIVETLMMIKPH